MLKIETPNNEDKVLLHSCCAPCSSAIIECLLANNIRPTVFYYNPNIYPQAEYDIRKAEAIRYVKALGLDFIDGDYDYQLWRSSMSGMEDEPERGGSLSAMFYSSPVGNSLLCRRAWFHTIHHYPCLFPLEKSRPD